MNTDDIPLPHGQRARFITKIPDRTGGSVSSTPKTTPPLAEAEFTIALRASGIVPVSGCPASRKKDSEEF